MYQYESGSETNRRILEIIGSPAFFGALVVILISKSFLQHAKSQTRRNLICEFPPPLFFERHPGHRRVEIWFRHGTSTNIVPFCWGTATLKAASQMADAKREIATAQLIETEFKLALRISDADIKKRLSAATAEGMVLSVSSFEPLAYDRSSA